LKKKSLKTLFLASAENNAKKHMYKRIEGKKKQFPNKIFQKTIPKQGQPPA